MSQIVQFSHDLLRRFPKTLRPCRKAFEVSNQAANVSSGTAEWKKGLIPMSAEELQSESEGKTTNDPSFQAKIGMVCGEKTIMVMVPEGIRWIGIPDLC